MAEPIKVALLTHAGGAHVELYLKALAETPECRSVTLVDPDGKWSGVAQRLLGDRLAGNFESAAEALRDPPAMALVSMEAALTPPVIDAALEAGCHVFAEKPACVKVDDFVAMVHKADRAHRYLMLALANRLNPEVVAARELLASGQIGTPFGLEMHLVADQTRLTRRNYHETWFAQKHRAGGGHLIWLGIHWLDLAMYVTGSRIAEAAGFTANVGKQPLDVEDSAAAALKFENGMLGTLTSGYYLDRGYHSHIKIWGSAGWLHLESMKPEPLHWYSNKGPKAGEVQKWNGSKEPRGYTPMVQSAVKACAQMSDPPITSGESLRALQTVFAIYRASETGRSVAVPG